MADARYDGRTVDELRALLDLPRVEVFESVTSTLDVAHTLGALGAPAGTLVLAERQTAGRGRAGRVWASAPGAGIWLTLLERPNDASAVELLSLRVGLAAARALDPFAGEPVRVKWPNDLHLASGKLAGVLIEARWRDDRVDWVAVGLGVNVRPPADIAHAASLDGVTDRCEVLAELVPALRAAIAARGLLDDAELDAFARRDLARGRRCVEPVVGEVDGIDARGALVVRTIGGPVECRAGSLVLEVDA